MNEKQKKTTEDYRSNWDKIFGSKQPSNEDLAVYDSERLVSKYDKTPVEKNSGEQKNDDKNSTRD